MSESRKAAIRAYKERKPPRGIFAIRCTPTNTTWVESATDLEAAESRTFFLMKSGEAQMDKSAKEQLIAHGREAFTFEILEKFDDDLIPMEVKDLMKSRKLHWRDQLSSKTLWPL